LDYHAFLYPFLPPWKEVIKEATPRVLYILARSSFGIKRWEWKEEEGRDFLENTKTQEDKEIDKG
jgi:hypothetical protein